MQPFLCARETGNGAKIRALFVAYCAVCRIFGLKMNADVLDFDLPQECIAQTPAATRDGSRLLVVERENGNIYDAVFGDLPKILPEAFDIFRNDAAVLKARIFARREGGGAVECLLLSPKTPDEWTCMLKPGKKLKTGARFGVENEFGATVLEKFGDGRALVQFRTEGGIAVPELAQKIGVAPLPPYIRREQNSPSYDKSFDNERYETVYADSSKRVAAAAPTAGLHFTEELNGKLSSLGGSFFDITLHVGIGTFQPLKCDVIEEHAMHSESYEIPAATLKALKEKKNKRLAVGTTTIRTLEDFSRKGGVEAFGAEAPYFGDASLFIYPPQKISCADALVTNFHLPRSTLLCLVAAFLCPGDAAGIEKLKEIYAGAIARGYKFFSYGDAMLIL